MAEIETYDVDVTGESDDFGTCYKITCPECQEEIRVAENGIHEQKCSCGYTWGVSLVATGTK
jgi:hypothetical protein